jgi:phage repressor protein C with HTH and peptisase S24 domain
MKWFEKIRHRREELKISQAELGANVGVTQAAINKIERGGVARSRFTPIIAARLNIPLSELIEGAVDETQQDAVVQQAVKVMRMPELAAGRYGFGGEIPVFGSAEAGPGELTIGTEQIGTVQRPLPLQGIPEGFGVYIVGESMEPEFEAGDTAFVHPRLPPVPNATCIFYSGEQPEALRATIKRLVRATPTEWRVRQWNPPPGQKPEFTLKKADWPVCWRVVGKYSRR